MSSSYIIKTKSMDLKKVVDSLYPDGIILIGNVLDNDLHTNYQDRLYVKDERVVLFSTSNKQTTQIVYSRKPREDVAVHKTRDEVEKAVKKAVGEMEGGYVYWIQGVTITPLGGGSVSAGGGSSWILYVGIAVVAAGVGWFVYKKYFTKEEVEERLVNNPLKNSVCSRSLTT